METFRDEWFKANVCDRTFVQENHSKSSKAYCAACITKPKTRKANSCASSSAEVFDVAVNMRKDSPTFGKWAWRNPVGRKQAPTVGTRRFRTRFLRFER